MGKIIKVSASMLSEKPGEMTVEVLTKFIKDLENCGIDSIHWDVIDGKYNNGRNTLAYQGPEAIKKLRGITDLVFVAHLMIANPLGKIEMFRDAGCDGVTFHYEACENGDIVRKTIEKIRSYNMRAGIAIEPGTPVKKLDPYLPDINEILVMTVRTGFAGQGFMDMTDKIGYLDEKRRIDGLKFDIVVDGGVNVETGGLCKEAGADILAAASYIRKNDYGSAIKSLRGL